MRKVADVVAEQCRALGAEVVFTVSGNQNLPLLEAFHEAGTRIVHCRHESGAVYMAQAWGELRGKPPICILTAGPGHTSGLTALAASAAAEAPLVCLSGASNLGERGAFQEMDQASLAAQTGSRAYTLSAPGEASVLVGTAWRLAVGPVPGPVHISMPMDVLNAPADSPTFVDAFQEEATVDDVPPESLETVRRLLEQAQHPCVVVRPSLGRECRSLIAEAARHGVLAFTADSPRGLGDPALVDCRDDLGNTDLLVIIGALDFAVAYGHPDTKRAKPRVVMVTSIVPELVAGSGRLGEDDVLIRGQEKAWLDLVVRSLRDSHPVRKPRAGAGCRDIDDGEPLHPFAISREVLDQMRADDIVVVDGGEFGQWVRAGLRDCRNRSVYNGKLGAIGGSIPQAVGAAIAVPGCRAIAFVGDGAFGYYASELDTAAREGLDILVVVGNDSRWSAEWHLQREKYGRTVATELAGRSYDLVASGLGGEGKTVRTLRELRSELEVAGSAEPGVRCLNVVSRSVPIAALDQ